MLTLAPCVYIITSGCGILPVWIAWTGRSSKMRGRFALTCCLVIPSNAKQISHRLLKVVFVQLTWIAQCTLLNWFFINLSIYLVFYLTGPRPAFVWLALVDRQDGKVFTGKLSHFSCFQTLLDGYWSGQLRTERRRCKVRREKFTRENFTFLTIHQDLGRGPVSEIGWLHLKLAIASKCRR